MFFKCWTNIRICREEKKNPLKYHEKLSVLFERQMNLIKRTNTSVTLKLLSNLFSTKICDEITRPLGISQIWQFSISFRGTHF